MIFGWVKLEVMYCFIAAVAISDTARSSSIIIFIVTVKPAEKQIIAVFLGRSYISLGGYSVP